MARFKPAAELLSFCHEFLPIADACEGFTILKTLADAVVAATAAGDAGTVEALRDVIGRQIKALGTVEVTITTPDVEPWFLLCRRLLATAKRAGVPMSEEEIRACF
jgi:hypothetical protein